MHGEGKLTWHENSNNKNKPPIKCVYKGQMFSNVIHGVGILEKSTGDRYEGEFANGIFSGEGIYRWGE